MYETMMHLFGNNSIICNLFQKYADYCFDACWYKYASMIWVNIDSGTSIFFNANLSNAIENFDRKPWIIWLAPFCRGLCICILQGIFLLWSQRVELTINHAELEISHYCIHVDPLHWRIYAPSSLSELTNYSGSYVAFYIAGKNHVKSHHDRDTLRGIWWQCSGIGTLRFTAHDIGPTSFTLIIRLIDCFVGNKTYVNRLRLTLRFWVVSRMKKIFWFRVAKSHGTDLFRNTEF